MVCFLIHLLSDFIRSSLEIFVLTSAAMLVTTTVFAGGLYKSTEESYFTKLHRKVLKNMDTEEEDQENASVPLLESPARQTPATASTNYSTSLVTLCAVGFLGSYGEGAMVTWSVIYFERYIDVPTSLRSIGFFTFMICMAIGRFSCDFLRKSFGRRKLIRVSGIFAGVGMCLIIVAPVFKDQLFEIFVSEVGVVFTGLGLSTIVPTVFSSAGHLPGTHAGTSIATVAAFTYCGSIVAPPLIGGISQGFHSLRYSAAPISSFISISLSYTDTHSCSLEFL
jgi:fucose permease